MTEDEKRQQKAMLLLDFEEAVEELKHLQERSKRVAEDIALIAEWVKRSTGSFTGKDYDQHTASIDASVRANLAKYREVLNIDIALKSIEECNAAGDRVKELRSRKDALGLTSR